MTNNSNRLLNNVMALGTIQLVNFIIPLITLPYLTRTLGVEMFGKIAFVQVVMTFASLFTDFGFSWSATREIAAVRHDRAKVAIIFSANWAAQWLLVTIIITI